MQSFNDENARIDEIAAKIAMDQVISVKVLRMANLRRPAPGQRGDLHRAGGDPARLQTGCACGGRLRHHQQLQGPGFDKHHFWTQTFQVATIARTLAQQTRAVDPRPPSPAPSFTTSASC